jgi:hypothetical protein
VHFIIAYEILFHIGIGAANLTRALLNSLENRRLGLGSNVMNLGWAWNMIFVPYEGKLPEIM